jgi:hypothetical protein
MSKYFILRELMEPLRAYVLLRPSSVNYRFPVAEIYI